MARLIRRSILNGFVILTLFAILLGNASAQHPIAPVPHPVPGVHVPTTVMPHPPVFSPPVYHAPTAPVPYAPMLTNRTSSGAFGVGTFRPIRPVHLFPPPVIIYRAAIVFNAPLWTSNHCWWNTCDLLYPWTINYAAISSPGPLSYLPQMYETPVYIYGPERPDLPQLFLKDGTILNVTDYWVVDDQLHFTMMGEDGKSMERAIPFDALDLQTTVDANTERGFRFMLRNEPFEQYLRDHPEGPPKALVPEHP